MVPAYLYNGVSLPPSQSVLAATADGSSEFSAEETVLPCFLEAVFTYIALWLYLADAVHAEVVLAAACTLVPCSCLYWFSTYGAVMGHYILFLDIGLCKIKRGSTVATLVLIMVYTLGGNRATVGASYSSYGHLIQSTYVSEGVDNSNEHMFCGKILNYPSSHLYRRFLWHCRRRNEMRDAGRCILSVDESVEKQQPKL